eukprot:186220_1
MSLMKNKIIIPTDIVSFLIKYDVFKATDFQQQADQNRNILNDECKLDFLSGYACSLLLHRIGIKRNVESSFAFENVSINSTNKYSSANTVFNWNNLIQDLKQYNVNLDKDTKLLIIAGDYTMIIKL